MYLRSVATIGISNTWFTHRENLSSFASLSFEGKEIEIRPGKESTLFPESIMNEDLEAKRVNEEDAYSIDEEHTLIMEIFKAGLKNCSPKVLLSLMPPDKENPLNTEHIKSHLQKYRNNSSKSTDSFLIELQTKFADWRKAEGWKNDPEVDLEKISVSALEVVDVNGGSRSLEFISKASPRELRSTRSSSVPNSGEVGSILDQHRALFSEFLETTDEFIELGASLRNGLLQLDLLQPGRGSLKRKRT